MTIFGEFRRLLRLPQPYRRADFEARERLRPAYTVVADALLEQLEFETVVDVGCGNGFLLNEFDRAGKKVEGIERSRHVMAVLPRGLQDAVRIADFSEVSGRFDLVCCVEVAEHIPAGRSEELIGSLVGVASDWIYFTAAPPGQSGHGHINCRPISDWLEMFERRGWIQDVEATLRFRQKLMSLEQANWLIHNSVLLRRSAGSETALAGRAGETTVGVVKRPLPARTST